MPRDRGRRTCPAGRRPPILPRVRLGKQAESPQPPDDQLDRLFRAAWALCGEREQAEDLVAATYARTLVQPRALRRGDDPGHMLRELRRTLGASRRGKRRRGVQPGMPQPLEPAAAPPALAPDRALEPRAVYAAVAALPEELRDVLVAVDVLGLGRRQTARALRIREPTVERRLDRARAELARALAAGGP